MIFLLKAINLRGLKRKDLVEKMMNNKELLKNDRVIHNLRYPDEDVIKFLFQTKAYGNRVLDFGCGSGRNTIVMADLDLEICAMDYNKECLDLTKEKVCDYKKIRYVVNEETEIPLEDECIDRIVAWGALFNLNSDKEKKLLNELRRVLCNGGLLLADYRAVDDSLYWKGKEIDKNLFVLDETCGSLSGISYAFKSEQDIVNMYEQCGFSIINLEKKQQWTNSMSVCNSHYIVWAKKVTE